MTTAAKANPQTVPSRREMLNYAFGASIALALAGSCGGLLWFSKELAYLNDAKGLLTLDLNQLPVPKYRPIYLQDYRCFLSNPGDGLRALYARCPESGCLVKWSVANGRFEDPCHGSKFQSDGTYSEGPSKRSLDHLVLTVTTDHGTFTTPKDGSSLPLDGVKSIVLNINYAVRGKAGPPRLT